MAESNVVKLKPLVPCPVCKKPSSQHYHPFCSGRCQDIDLNRWLSGSYVIPGEAVEDEDKAPERGEEDED